MVLTDTHTHLYAPQLAEDLDEVIQRAEANAVQRFFLPNIDAESIPALFDLVERDPDRFFPMMGLHPTSVNANVEQDLAWVESWLFRKPEGVTGKVFRAVGEIGIDLYWDRTFIKEQQHAFSQQIEWAKALGLPIVIHCRDAFEEVFAVVEAHNDDALTGIFHCFTGTEEQAQRIINYGGFKLGIGGVVTFKKAGLDQVLKTIDPAHIVLETDAPYLAPAPHRGKRNESSYLRLVAEKVAEVYGLPLEEVAQITTANAQQIFGI